MSQKQMADNVVVDRFNIELKAKFIARLADKEWLQDEVINFLFHMIEERSTRQEKSGSVLNLKVRTVSTYVSGDPNSKAPKYCRWLKHKKDIFEADLALVPFNISDNHWALVVANFNKKRFEYYDSMCTSSSETYYHSKIEVVKNCFKAEANHRGIPFVFTEPNVVRTVDEIPEQMNGYDCGMFICTYADYLAQDLEFDFTQEDMPRFRLKMVKDIRQERLYMTTLSGYST